MNIPSSGGGGGYYGGPSYSYGVIADKSYRFIGASGSSYISTAKFTNSKMEKGNTTFGKAGNGQVTITPIIYKTKSKGPYKNFRLPFIIIL